LIEDTGLEELELLLQPSDLAEQDLILRIAIGGHGFQ
jgi:hypothetical protein